MKKYPVWLSVVFVQLGEIRSLIWQIFFVWDEDLLRVLGDRPVQIYTARLLIHFNNIG